MPIYDLPPLTQDDVDTMNTGLRQLGPESADLISYGECEDLADYLDMGVATVQAWFQVPGARGFMPRYSRGVTLDAVGVRPIEMYPPPPHNDNLRIRMLLGACAGTPQGMNRDQLFHGEQKSYVKEFGTLSVCLDHIDSLFPVGTPANYQTGALYMQKAWVQMLITEGDEGFPWRVIVYYVQGLTTYDSEGNLVLRES